MNISDILGNLVAFEGLIHLCSLLEQPVTQPTDTVSGLTLNSQWSTGPEGQPFTHNNTFLHKVTNSSTDSPHANEGFPFSHQCNRIRPIWFYRKVHTTSIHLKKNNSPAREVRWSQRNSGQLHRSQMTRFQCINYIGCTILYVNIALI